jgi:predicted amidohydrolase
MENRVFIITAGRVGSDPGPDGMLEFKAGSRIVDPDGKILAAGPDDRIGCDMIDIDPVYSDDKFVTPGNHILQERYAQDINE